MIDVRDIMVGDYLKNTNGNVGRVIGIQPYNQSSSEIIMSYNGGTCFSDPKMLNPIPLTAEALEKNGWEKHEGIYVLKSQPRLGWYPKTKQIIIDYHTFVITIEFVHTLQHIIRLLGLEEDIVL